MTLLRIVLLSTAALLLAACGGGGGSSNSSNGNGSSQPVAIVELTETMIATATTDDAEPWPVDTLAVVTTPDDTKPSDL